MQDGIIRAHRPPQTIRSVQRAILLTSKRDADKFGRFVAIAHYDGAAPALLARAALCKLCDQLQERLEAAQGKGVPLRQAAHLPSCVQVRTAHRHVLQLHCSKPRRVSIVWARAFT